MSEAVFLALLAAFGAAIPVMGAAIVKLWLDVKALTASDTECKVARAEDRGKIAVLESRCQSLQEKIDQVERFSLRTKHTPEQAIVEANGLGIITEWSPGAEGLFGWNRAEAIGKRIATLLVPVDLRSRHDTAIRSLIESSRTSLTHKIPNTRSLRKSKPEIFVDIHLEGWKNSAESWSLIANFEQRNEGEIV